MDDDLHERIEALVAEEHLLRRAHEASSGLGDEQRARLRAVEQGLDRTWDLLRQRQARRAAGQDPLQAAERDIDVVEGYLN